VILVTNGSSRSRETQRLRLEKVGLTIAETNIFTSAFSVAVYLSQVVRLGDTARSRVFVIGEAGLEAELADAGLPTVGGTDPAFQRDSTPEDFRNLASGAALLDDVGAVVVANETRVTHLKILHAMQYVRQRDALFVAPLCDVISPAYGAFFPAGGFWSQALASLVEREPVMTGKPSKAMMDSIRSQHPDLDLARTCMVGDYMKTDMRFAIDNGVCGTLLVMTGASTEESLKDPALAQWLPDVYLESLGHLKP